MNRFTVLKYINYIIFARHRYGHGLHSPFAFSLVSDIFRNKIQPDIVCTIEKERQRLLSDSRQIRVNDLGAGSVKMKKSLRKVSEIARYSSVPVKYGILLSNMAKAFGAHGVVELGTSLGISTMYMAASCRETPVITIEGCSATSAVALENFRSAGLDNIRLINGSFDDVLPVLKKEGIRPGLVFIDGNHRKNAVRDNFEIIAEITGKDSVVIIDDIYSSAGMSEAWNEIKGHENVTLTVDIFRMGMVFFREGLTRYDYMIRY